MNKKDMVWNGAGETRKDKAYRQEREEFFNLPILNEASNEHADSESGQTNRRDFLKYVGFSVGAAAIAASCETPIRKAIPYVTKPDSIVPGVATYYASSFYSGGQFCPVLVKTREGRPIKIEGNGLSPFAGGGTSARVQASVLDLYDQSRYRKPSVKDESGAWAETSWEELDKEITKKLKASQNIRLVTNSIISPSYKKAIRHFESTFNAQTVVYDPISSSAILKANEADFGKQMIPGYDFSKADYIVSFGADFLGTWISPVQFANQFGKGRKIKDVSNPVMNKLVSIECGMSLTGSNADQKVLIRPSEQGMAIATLYNLLNAGPRVNVSGSFANEKASGQLETLAQELQKSKSSLVVSDSNNTTEQQLINRINRKLGNYGQTILPAKPMYVKQGIDSDLQNFTKELQGGRVDAIIFLDDANPIYDTPFGREIEEALQSVKTIISCQYSKNESAEAAHYLAPVDHYLEAWSDANPSAGYHAIVQPTIQRIFDTRSGAESLLVWSEHDLADTIQKSNEEKRGYYEFIRSNWETDIFSNQTVYNTFQSFWDNVVHDGFILQDDWTEPYGEFGGGAVDVRGINEPVSDGLEMKLFEPIGVGAGNFANNPWLQEMPDPITRVVWDNTLQIPLHWNGTDDFEVFNDLDEDGSLVEVTVGDFNSDLPTIKQFGQFENTVSAALGYGRKVCGRAGTGVGVNLFPILPVDPEGNIQYYVTSVGVGNKKGSQERFAMVQYHHTMGVTGPDESEGGKTINVDEKAITDFFTGFQGALVDRTVIRHSALPDLQESMEELAEERAHAKYLNDKTLYPSYDYEYNQGHHWGMSVDMSACIGCGACQVACVAENNVPVVGKKEVNRHHEMTWLRIDRYYYGDVENPRVVYQPMMCQHCDNAPCENVCPVAATVHSSEGINQMAYNRCIGTRYCANNCPYKVRRFNWLDYTTADTFPANEPTPYGDENFYTDDLVRMVLNPDVTVRSRGVMEKCSMCVQRIQEGKLKAKVEGRALQDGEVKTACQTACPTGAIVFGDMNNKDAEVNELLESPLTYYALEEVNTRSSVGYRMKVSNIPSPEHNI
ncbi:4Fe-4S dicluster domain-containing protein [Membranicola marinus]|uniref:4Fe-4S dicluster domain-containing protein n=1 Tax=Membranihabitans marinus TaxID=1227546 RepID=A0A953L7S2_9BACT|nr:4Fe-4S dicluster domain-containing protein [Membranihabitans marinus]MBY5959022.1 4Fe-4S dicluster domain-containing protein [Membranihabitans marinus]